MTPVSALEWTPQGVELGQNFLLLGEDAWLVDRISDQIRIKFKQIAAAELVIIYGDEVKIAELNDLLDSYSIFSSAKLILFRNADMLKKPELDCLAEYLQDPSDVQSVIVMADRIDARVAGWKKIKDSCQIVTCDPPKWGSQLGPWLNQELETLGKSMSSKARELFMSRVELDFANASNELHKLALLAGDRKQITEQDVLRAVGVSRVGTQIDFYRSLGNRQTRQCMELLEKMLASEWASLQVLSLIIRFYLTIYNILLLRKNHISPSEISRSHLMEVFQSQRQEFLRFAENYSLSQMPGIFATLLETDSQIKLSAASDSVLLTACIVKLLETA